MQKIIAFLRDEDGASAGEYALILAIIGSAVAIASFALGNNISTGLGVIGSCIANPSGVTAAGCPAAAA
jgi:pilus assembly protein Flp/PilA